MDVARPSGRQCRAKARRYNARPDDPAFGIATVGLVRPEKLIPLLIPLNCVWLNTLNASTRNCRWAGSAGRNPERP